MARSACNVLLLFFHLLSFFSMLFMLFILFVVMKYNLQVRIGCMGGIFVAYHNTKEMFGFEYLSKEDLDQCLFGIVLLLFIYFIFVYCWKTGVVVFAWQNKRIEWVWWQSVHVCEQIVASSVWTHRRRQSRAQRAAALSHVVQSQQTVRGRVHWRRSWRRRLGWTSLWLWSTVAEYVSIVCVCLCLF